MKTKTKEILSPKASNSVLKPSGNPIIGNSNRIGALNITQAHEGQTKPNAASAIMDISSIIELPINTILTNSDGINPAGIQQVIEIKFEGMYTPYFVTSEDKNKEQIEYILGVKTLLKVGYTAKEVARAFSEAAKLYIENNELFSDVILNADGDSLMLTPIDYSNHTFDDFAIGFQMRVFTETVSPAKFGYGTWIKLGMETKSLPGSAETLEFHYFKRIA